MNAQLVSVVQDFLEAYDDEHSSFDAEVDFFMGDDYITRVRKALASAVAPKERA
jgi:hypothetical protein